MIVAALETSSRPGSVALGTEAGTSVARLEDARRHASDLLPALDGLLRAAGLGPRDLDAVCVGIGPGSYTGLRVGVATALGLAASTGAVLRAVPSFEALALRAARPGHAVCVALDARAEGFYFARYGRSEDGSDVEQLVPPCVLAREELLQRLRADAGGVRALVDDGVYALARESGVEAGRLERNVTPDAGDLLALGRVRLQRYGPSRVEECEPLYLRAFAVKRGGRGAG